ncbi:MMPL family transporter [Conexibacter sp. DBS9H8]|uniref:MMPL family transporter n=1 Tax=Conexibacter sp. DBS9H8 TaxID=2937801 RepID=UPI0020104BE5|nr:MMPL family transporter [Conexibacter sp. DBS9H8]
MTGLIGFAAIAQSVGSAYKNSFSLKGTQSFEALALLQRAAPRAAGDVEQVVFSVAHGAITDPAARTRVQALLARIGALPEVSSVASPFAAGNAAQISSSGRIGFANVILDKQGITFTVSQAKRFVAAVRAGAGGGLSVAVEGQVAEQTVTNNVSRAGFGAIAALIVLFLVFGSLLAAVLPLITAGFALGVGTAVVGLLSHLLDMASFSSELALLIGLGVGVDYALFIVTRHRQGLQQGKSVEASIVEALDTSGRAVMFAGITVCIALLGMFALGVSFLYGVAVAAAVVVAFTVFSALTLLPALLGFFGPRILSRRARRALAAQPTSSGTPSGPWVRWTGVLQARPALIAATGVLVMALIAVPFFSMRLGSSDAGSDPAGSTTRQAYDLLARGFGPGYNGPLQLVAQASGSAQQAAFSRVLTAVAHTPGVVRVTPPHLLPGAGGAPAVISADAYPVGSPQAASTGALLSTLRDTVVPRASARSGLHVLIGGQTAIFADFASVLSAKLPLFIGVVVLLSFLLLTAVFRSLVIPATAAVMNMLSAGAAFGVVTAVFQWGWLSSVFGISTGPIEAFIPVMMFAILFGLSMDYEVFLLARIYEEWHRTRDNRLAVTRGLAATGRTITAAAAIMILVFGSFIFGGQVTIEMFGLGLAAAVLLDALIVRSIIVPALMLVIGAANWALPRALERVLPRLNVEGAASTGLDGPAEPPASEPREVVGAGR